MPNPYRAAFAGTGEAPRLEAGWAALKALLSAGPATRRECVEAICATGLAEKTASNMLTQAIHTGNLRRPVVRYELVLDPDSEETDV